ncbi:MAG: Clp1/GlmU family protein [Hadesarchaea archaeon]|nr:Clp1/GlmU family protein [Hadesarchaea archaeon]
MPELKFKRGDVVRLEGQLSLEVKEGEVSVSGGLQGKGSKVVIPRSKSVPLEAEGEALIEYTLGQEGKIEQLSERTIPKEWDTLISEVIQRRPKTILVMGNVDVGKTFFTTYLSNKLLRHGLRAGAVDSDVGQADIGPPTTMGLGVFEQPVALLYEVPLSNAYFVGSMSPSGHMLEFVVGMKWLVEHGLKKADLVIVNTPGWISGGPGRALQLYTFELIGPDMIVALQRERELEHLLASLPPSRVRRLPVSTKVRPRSHGERAALRAMLVSKYFEDAGKLVLDLRRIRFERSYMGTGTPIDPQTLESGTNVIHAEKIPEGLLLVTRRKLSDKTLQELESKFRSVRVIKQGSERNLIVGLANDASELLGLGIIEKIDYERGHVVVLTPVKNADEVAAVQIGSMKIKPTGEEVGTVRPGTF